MTKIWFALSSAIWSLSTFAQTAPTCFIDSAQIAFEETYGYKIDVAQDGTSFTPEEKIAFNKIAAVLPPLYQNMKTLQRFERVPNGYRLEDGAVGNFQMKMWRYGANTRILGQIEACEGSLKTQHGRLVGDFYFTIVHEMSHALDQSLAISRGDFSMKGISGSPAWTSLPAEFVTEYAATGASEDFAESLAYFILDPDLLLAKAPHKFEFISQNLFGGARYDSTTLSAKYNAILAPLGANERRAKIDELKQTDYYACKILL